MGTERKNSGFGPLQVFTFGFGTIVGIAWVVLMGQLLAYAGLAGAFMGLTVGAAMMVLVGSCYAEVGAKLPLAGGEVAYVREIYSLKASHLLGWFLLLSCILVCGFEMVSVGWLIAQLWPPGTRLYSVAGNDVFLEPLLASIGVQLLIATVNYRGAQGAGRLQAITTGTKLALSICFVLAAFRVAKPSYASPLFVSSGNSSAFSGILSVVAVAPFWFSGFNAIAQTISGRSQGTSARKAAGMITLSLVAAWAFYSVVLIAIALTMPRHELLSNSLPTAAAFQVAFQSPLIGRIVLFAALLGLISTWNALFFSATRILWVLSESGFVGSMFRPLHPRFGTPVSATVVIAIAIPLCALLGKAGLGPLLNLFSIIMAAIYAIVCYGLIRLRRRDSRDRPTTLFGASLPYLALAVCGVIAALSIVEPLKAWSGSGIPKEWLALLAWSACGVWLLGRYRRPA